MRDIFLLTIEYIDPHVDTQIIDAPNLKAALACQRRRYQTTFQPPERGSRRSGRMGTYRRATAVNGVPIYGKPIFPA